MKLRHIEVFHAVYTTGSVSAAARQLNVSQPAVTNLLRHAESLLGFTLFERTRGRLVPTADAHDLYEQASGIQEQVYQFRETARNIRLGQGQLLRLSALPSLGMDLLPAEVARYAGDHPGVVIELHTVHHDDMAMKLYERETDLVICYTPPRGAPVTNIRLGTAEMVAYLPETMLREAQAGAQAADENGRLPLAAFAGLPFVSTTDSGPQGRAIAGEFASRGIEPPVVGASRTFSIAAAMARAGLGATIVDWHTAQAMAGSGAEPGAESGQASGTAPGMAIRRLDPPQRYAIHASHLEARPPSMLAMAFLDRLKDKLQIHK